MLSLNSPLVGGLFSMKVSDRKLDYPVSNVDISKLIQIEQDGSQQIIWNQSQKIRRINN